MRRVLTALIVIVFFVTNGGLSAWADNVGPIAWGEAGNAGITAGAVIGSSAPGAASAVGTHNVSGGASGCPQGYSFQTWTDTAGNPVTGQPGQVNPISGQSVPVGSTPVDVFCGGSYVSTTYRRPAGPTGPAVSPVVLARQAVAEAAFPVLAIRTDPPSGRLVVNFPVWLSLSSGFAPVSASASAGSVTSSVSVRPVSVTWSMGDGGSVTCDGPGVAFDPARPFDAQVPPPCGYSYARSSATELGQQFTVTATVSFRATWTVSGAAGGGVLGPVVRSVSVPVRVGEIEAVS